MNKFTFIRQRKQHKNTNTHAQTYLDNTKHKRPLYKIDRITENSNARGSFKKSKNSLKFTKTVLKQR